MTMAPMQQASDARISHRPPGAEAPHSAGRAPSALGAADGVVKARIIAAVAGMATPLSVTSAPCAALRQTIAETGPEASPAQPHHEQPSVLPHYPPLGRYGDRLERVEAVSRFAGAGGGWSGIETRCFDYGDEPAPEPDDLMEATALPAEPDRDLGVVDADARNEGGSYRQQLAWLRTHRQEAALRELTQRRRVLLLIPPDEPRQSWQGRLMCPASAANAAALCAPGAQGQSWPLRVKGAFASTELAGRWQHWRMHQHMRADGAWQLEQASEGPPAPVWCGDSAPQLLSAAGNGIPLHLTEPRRLRRLLGTQWTLLMLLAPQPLPPGRRV
jgi:hypothetical protein